MQFETTKEMQSQYNSDASLLDEQQDQRQPKRAVNNFASSAEDQWHAILDSGDFSSFDESILTNDSPLHVFIQEKFGFSSPGEMLVYAATTRPEDPTHAQDPSGNSWVVKNVDLAAMDAVLADAFASEVIDTRDLQALDAVPDKQKFVEIDTTNGPVQFFGNNSGAAAKAFVQVYNNSALFRENFDNYMENNGEFVVKSNMNQDSNTPTYAANGYVQDDVPNTLHLIHPDESHPVSADAIRQMRAQIGQPALDAYLQLTLVHEFVHLLIHEGKEGRGDPLLATQADSHGRDHTLFMGAVFHEMDLANESALPPGSVESWDYSDNARIFGAFAQDTSSDALDYIQVQNEYTNEYVAIVDALNESPPDYARAEKALKAVDKDVELTSHYDNVDESSTRFRSTTVNVQDLFLQELMLEGGRAHIYGEGIVPVQDETTIGGFMNYLVQNAKDSDAQVQKLQTIGGEVRVPLEDLPGFTGLETAPTTRPTAGQAEPAQGLESTRDDERSRRPRNDDGDERRAQRAEREAQDNQREQRAEREQRARA